MVRKKNFSQSHLDLARLFFKHGGERFLKLNPTEDLKKLGDEWADEFRKMEKIDNCAIELARALIIWLFTSESDDAIFWRKNIHSPKKFRKKNKDGIQYWRLLVDIARMDTKPKGVKIR